MISDLMVNISLLVSFTFVWHQLFRNHRLTLTSPLKIKILDGLIAGGLGIILMHYKIFVNEFTFLDLRHIPVLLVIYYGGAIPGFIAAAVISAGRFFMDVNISSTTSLVMMFLIAGGASIIARYIRKRVNKWVALLAFSQIVFTTALNIVSTQSVLNLAFYHIISSFIGGLLVFYFVSYIRNYSEMYLKYKTSSQRDSLTGLYNVRSFDHYYNLMIGNAKKESVNCAICLIDVDYFKRINDTYGHLAGDEVLRQMAKLLTKMTRIEDILSRNGGEEFSILLNNCTVQQAEEIALRIRKCVETHSFVLPDKRTIQITVSIGISAYDGQKDLSNYDLYQEADDALYRAKRNGRNSICLSPAIQ